MKHILSNMYQEVLRFERGEELTEGLLHFAEGRKINSAWISGIGAAKEVEIGYYDIAEKKYKFKTFKEELEVLDITGNIGIMDNKPVFHIHGSFSRHDLSVIGGHVNKLIVNFTLELFLHKMSTTIYRKHDPEVGLNLLKPYGV